MEGNTSGLSEVLSQNLPGGSDKYSTEPHDW
jgi:hypothetical protein